MATIRARYEKGVLTPLEPLDLEEGREVDVYVPNDGERRETVANGGVPQVNPTPDDSDTLPVDSRDPFDTEEPPPGMNPTIWRIANLHKKFPPDSFDHIPSDLSVNYKHYLYGHPQVPEDE